MIDVNFDFTTDSEGFWNGFWDRNDGMGSGSCDPDSDSPTLKKYHKMLWSKALPNGEIMDLHIGNKHDYLTWKNFRFGADSIIVSFRYKSNKNIISQVKDKVDDYKLYYEQLIRKSYTIGGNIIFPKHSNSMNQNRGTNKYISDRWDLTMECIRRYYSGVKSPLSAVIEEDRDFYDLFVDFKGYVDFFLLQDCVNDDYTKVDIWCGDTDFTKYALPKTVDEYFSFINKELDFLNKRNMRIKEYSETYLKKSDT